MPTQARLGLTAVTGVRRVMIRCEESGEGVPVGLSLSRAAFKDLTEQTLKCPHCHREHSWSAKNAWTETIYVASS